LAFGRLLSRPRLTTPETSTPTTPNNPPKRPQTHPQPHPQHHRQASYALGYNLAIEYLADYEKTWMLDSFRDLNGRVVKREIDWVFLEVRGGWGLGWGRGLFGILRFCGLCLQ